ncbi:UDP-glucose 4-epimerase, partial [Vibrio sp. 10N.222.55.E8]
HNTDRLDVAGMIKLLHKLDFISDIEAGSLNVPEGV